MDDEALVSSNGDHEKPLLHLIGDIQCLFDHEGAYVNITSYLLIFHENKGHTQVTADDTDIFLLLVYFIWK